MRSLLSQLDAMLAEVIAQEVARYVGGKYRRPCAACGRKFEPRSRDNHLCSEPCRRAWYRGKFRPRKGTR